MPHRHGSATITRLRDEESKRMDGHLSPVRSSREWCGTDTPVCALRNREARFSPVAQAGSRRPGRRKDAGAMCATFVAYPFACNSNRISSMESAAVSRGSTHVPAPRCPPPP